MSPVGRLEQLAHTRAAGATDIVTYAWTFDAADRIKSFTNSTHSAENVNDYAYDDTNQVTGTDYASAVDEVFAYDANGNRTSATTQSSGSQSYDDAVNNRVTDDGVFTYVYDDEGNRIQRNRKSGTGDDAVTLYTWDHRNRLVRVINKNSGGTITMQADYVYDMFNHRIAKVVDADGAGAGASVSTLFVYDGNQIALQFSGSTSGSLTHRYLYGPAVDMLLADEQTSSASAGTIQTPLADHLGTVHDVVATNGTIGYHAVYDTFGHVTSSTGSTSILFGFTSQAYDTETGLSYHWNRYYDVIVGSWISEDPIGFGDGNNLNNYAHNAPHASIDPNGHKVIILNIPHSEAGPGMPQYVSQSMPLTSQFTGRTVPVNVWIDEWIANLTKLGVDDKKFSELVKRDAVKFDGKTFKGTFAKYLELVKREKDSVVITQRRGGYEDAKTKLKEILKSKDFESHDIVGIAMHSVRVRDAFDDLSDEIHMKFNIETVDAGTAVAALREIGKSATAHYAIVTCYNNKKAVQETYVYNGFKHAFNLSGDPSKELIEFSPMTITKKQIIDKKLTNVDPKEMFEKKEK